MAEPVKTRQHQETMSNGAELDSSLDLLRPKDTTDFVEMNLNRKAEMLAEAFKNRLPTPNELSNITAEMGVELATAVFARAIQGSASHGGFNRELRRLDISASSEVWDRSKTQSLEVVIVASNLFQSGRKWGDHVDSWRAWARSMGFTTDVIETDPRRSVAANARLIFEYLALNPERPRILVTYGQGSSELRYLLHRRVNRDANDLLPEEIENVLGWISVCGACVGSSSSQMIQMNRLSRLLFRLRMKVAGRNPVCLAETSAGFAVWKKPAPVPPRMSVVSILGLPYRWQQPMELQSMYDQIAKQLPNDGVVTVYEAAAYPGLLVPVPGMNHRAPDSMLGPVFKRVLALMALSIHQERSREERSEHP